MIWGLLTAAAALAFSFAMLRQASHTLRPGLLIFLTFYVLTSAIGATALGVPEIRELWALRFPTMDQRWLRMGDSFGYWFMVWGPLFICSLVAVRTVDLMRRPAVVFAHALRARIDIMPAAIVGLGMCAYCIVNLANQGYLGVSLFSGELMGEYKLNILLRTEMFSTLGTLHFACIYAGIPAVALVAMHRAVRRKSPEWGILFAALSLAACFLYISTLTKSNILIYGVEVVIGANALGLLRMRGALIAAGAGTLVLTGLSTLLGNSASLDVLLTGYNIIFREASDVPFYLGIFPDQIPYVGIDLGLGRFGIGPTIPSNQIVSNFMFPHLTWVQGAAPAAAHVMAYAQAGFGWSAATMVLVGMWIAFTGALRRVARNALAFSAFVGAATACYYLSQSDLVGAFDVAYGYKWWLGALVALVAVQRVMELALKVESKGTSWTNPSQPEL